MEWQFCCNKCAEVSALISPSKLSTGDELCPAHSLLYSFLFGTITELPIFVSLSSVGRLVFCLRLSTFNCPTFFLLFLSLCVCVCFFFLFFFVLGGLRHIHKILSPYESILCANEFIYSFKNAIVQESRDIENIVSRLYGHIMPSPVKQRRGFEPLNS